MWCCCLLLLSLRSSISYSCTYIGSCVSIDFLFCILFTHIHNYPCVCGALVFFSFNFVNAPFSYSGLRFVLAHTLYVSCGCLFLHLFVNPTFFMLCYHCTVCGRPLLLPLCCISNSVLVSTMLVNSSLAYYDAVRIDSI